RGSGDHQRIGWPSSYQGKIVRSYAVSSRTVPRSPPAASRPFGTASARRTSGNASGGSSRLIHLICGVVTRAAARRLLPGTSLGRAPVRAVPVDRGHVAVDVSPLLGEVAADGAEELGAGEPVGGPGRDRGEAAGDLVLALGARLEPRQPLLDAVLDTLVIAGFEVQRVVVPVAAPVAPVERIAADVEHGRRDR